MHDRRQAAVVALAIRHSREMASLMEGGIGAAREAFKELYLWCPEHVEHETAAEGWKACDGKRGELPFFSELMTYAVLGKNEARTLRSHLHHLGDTLGFSRVEMDRDFKEPEGADFPEQDDLDALEALLRGRAAYMLEDPEDKLPLLMRALDLVRTVVGAGKFGEGVEYLQVYPKDLRIGDRIVERGRFVEVLGFFTKNGKPSRKPVADRLTKEDKERGREKAYWGALIKTAAEDTCGWPVRSQDKLLVQRLREPDDA